ncbi:hypothetical protein E2562_001232 [Oryza meyeriana var. granulata]|uniref:Uncharacterized protein n=1 Tax=Oryza meyeriana var. granulata TaxID=110450 RepID=A0A6G1DCH3_9ORYZ|nr:hypothetical protein E2562_001232 [Oryza meyeriana var. granulata]
MCREVKCETCGKSTWAGCGRHVASVHSQIADGQHCSCRGWPGVVVPAAVATGEEKGLAAAAAETGKTSVRWRQTIYQSYSSRRDLQLCSLSLSI